jgi:hypothetical protein
LDRQACNNYAAYFFEHTLAQSSPPLGFRLVVTPPAVFENVLAVIFDDEAHSVGEKREMIIGHSRNNRLLLISFTERSNTIRIISARLATPREREDYEQNAF